jgi:hypothetical protein
MSITQFCLLTTLLVPPVQGAGSPESDYATTVSQISALHDRMNSGESVDADLMKALTELPRYAPQLAADPAAQQLRTRAQLQLARSALSSGDLETATWMVDEAIRSAMGDEIAVDDLGPTLAKLYHDRRNVLATAGTASVEITCTQPCRVFLDEHKTGMSTDQLPLGAYRLWIEGTEGAGAGQVHTAVLSLETDGQVVERVFDPGPRALHVDESGGVQDRKRARLMPRELEAAMVAVGLGMVGAGALLMGIRPERPDIAAGATMFGLGGAILITGSVTLGIDEVRSGKQRGHQAMVTWTFRF